MAKKTTRQRVDPAEAGNYLAASRQFFSTAELAQGCGYWNAAGLLLVHGAIALSDALAIKLKGVKSTSDDHKDAAALLGEVMAATSRSKDALTHFIRIIDEKNRVAYTGVSFRRGDLERMATHVQRFRAFTESVLR